MKLATWLLVGLLLAGAVGGFVAWRRATEPSRAWSEFLELEGVDVQKLTGSRRERAQGLFDRFARDYIEDGKDHTWHPWLLLRGGPPSSGERWAALGLSPRELGGSGGNGWIRVIAPRFRSAPPYVDEQGLIGPLESYPTTAVAGRRAEAESWVLSLAFAGPDPTTSHYSWDGKELHLLRVEDGQGRFRRRDTNQIHDGPLLNHPEPPTDSRWAETLNDPHPVPVLVALSWLAYRDEEGPLKSLLPILKTEIVHSALGRLALSPNPWIREAAELALRP